MFLLKSFKSYIAAKNLGIVVNYLKIEPSTKYIMNSAKIKNLKLVASFFLLLALFTLFLTCVPSSHCYAQITKLESRNVSLYAKKIYNTLADMRSDQSLSCGVFTATKGYYTAHDGGSGEYEIREKNNTDIDNGGSVIFLKNGNVAELITKGDVNVKQFGAKGDGITDDSKSVQAAVNVASTLIIPAGSYIFHTDITKDLTILISDNATLTTTNERPVFKANNCSVVIRGGIFYAGEDDDSRQFIYDRKIVPYPRSRGLISFINCHDCIISNIMSTYSKYGAVILLDSTRNVIVENCSFDKILHSGVQIIDHCLNTIVRNCRFTNIRYFERDYYCYAVSTGTRSLSNYFIPPEELVYDNNYIYNSEDSGLDTHGARNVIIRNNTILETVCAITAYNDNIRVKRPIGWNMQNILIENNFCKSTKSNNPNAKWKHPFVFLGAENCYTANDEGYEDNPGSFNAYTDCVVRNNFFKSSSNYGLLISLDRCSRNVVMDNNVIDCCDTKDTVPFILRNTINFELKNNFFRHYNKEIIQSRCLGTEKGNINFKTTRLDGTINRINTHYLDSLGSPQCLKQGEVFTEAGQIRSCVSKGLRVRESECPEDLKQFKIIVIDGVAIMQSLDGFSRASKNFLIPELLFDLYTVDNVFFKRAICLDLIDFSSFKIGNEIPDGVYIAKLCFTKEK